MNGSVRVLRLGGLEVGVHRRWLAIVALLVWSLAGFLLPQQYPDWPAWLHWLTAVTVSALLAWSVLLHELAHASVARRRGVRPCTLIVCAPGGAPAGWAMPARPGDELAIALAGPAANVVMAAALGGLHWLASAAGPPATAPLVLGAAINLMLATLNLLPAYPLDGAHALRAALWFALGDATRATLLVSSAGRVMGVLLVLVGVLFIVNEVLLGGSWIVFVGVLFTSAATNVRRSALESPRVEGKARPAQAFAARREIPLFYRGALIGFVRHGGPT